MTNTDKAILATVERAGVELDRNRKLCKIDNREELMKFFIEEYGKRKGRMMFRYYAINAEKYLYDRYVYYSDRDIVGKIISDYRIDTNNNVRDQFYHLKQLAVAKARESRKEK